MRITSSEVSAVAAVLAAGFAAFSGNESRKANEAARKMAKIDEERRHRELTPQFQFDWDILNPPFQRLGIKLVDPIDIQHLDRVTLTIRDSKKHHGKYSGTRTQEEIDSCIWAPLRFSPGLEGTSQDGRVAICPELVKLDVFHFQLGKTSVAPWTTEDWWKEYVWSLPIKIDILCELSGYRNWNLSYEIR